MQVYLPSGEVKRSEEKRKEKKSITDRVTNKQAQPDETWICPEAFPRLGPYVLYSLRECCFWRDIHSSVCRLPGVVRVYMYVHVHVGSVGTLRRERARDRERVKPVHERQTHMRYTDIILSEGQAMFSVQKSSQARSRYARQDCII